MNKVSKEKVELYEVVRPLLHSAYSEVKVMSGKKQSLDKVLILLKDEPTIEFLQKLDEDDLPTNSDAVLILSQSLSAMDQFHLKYFHSDEWEAFRTGKWQTEDDEEE